MKINNFFFSPKFANYFMLGVTAMMAALGFYDVVFESSHFGALYSLFSSILCWESVSNKKRGLNVNLTVLFKVLFMAVLLVNAISICTALYKIVMAY
jgi:hypothetical protein